MLNNDKTLEKVREALALGFTILPEHKALKTHILRKFGTCAHCDRPSEHVALIQSAENGGEFEAENLKPMCSKHKIDDQLKSWFLS
jgi:hypothetical protein